MQQTGRQHRTGRAYRVAMRDCTTFYIDDFRIQTEVLRDCNCYRREGFIDLNALDVRDFPAGTIERLLYRRHRTQSEHARLNSAYTVGNEARHGREALLVGPSAIGHDHR